MINNYFSSNQQTRNVQNEHLFYIQKVLILFISRLFSDSVFVYDINLNDYDKTDRMGYILN